MSATRTPTPIASRVRRLLRYGHGGGNGRRLGVGVALVFATGGFGGTPTPRKPADTAPATVTVAPPRSHWRAPRAPAKPSAPVAGATLHVTPGALGTPWTFEVTNSDSTPLRIVTDGRLLTLDLLPAPDDDESAKKPAKKVAVSCVLPSELRPTTDDDNAHVLAPGLTYVEEFDPRYYCFDGRGLAALVPGAQIVAHLGWTPRASTATSSPPFIADETLNGESRSGAKQLTADAVIVPEPLDTDETEGRRRPLLVEQVARIDAESVRNILMDITVENTTSRPVRLMLRPETLSFEVSSSRGIHGCAWKSHPAAPIAEVFSTIPPHGKIATNVLLNTMCPDTVFQHAGLYSVRARLDTRRASGRSIGIETFDGTIDAFEPTLVRVRHDRPARP